MRTQLESALPGLRAVNFYGLSEMCGPGVAAECIEARDGLHVHEDHFLVEVVDPESGRVLPEGEEGEFVFTTLAKEAMPFLRYRTGDIGSVTFEPCRCGRTTARIRGLRGRRDDMIIIRGVNVYPSNVEHALLSVPEAAPHYQLSSSAPARWTSSPFNASLQPPKPTGQTYGAQSSGYCANTSAYAFAPKCWTLVQCREVRERRYASSTGADESTQPRSLTRFHGGAG